LTTSEMRKPRASCIVPTLGVVVAVLTNEYSNGTGIRVPGYPFQYWSGTRVFKYPEVRALFSRDLTVLPAHPSTFTHEPYMPLPSQLKLVLFWDTSTFYLRREHKKEEEKQEKEEEHTKKKKKIL